MVVKSRIVRAFPTPLRAKGKGHLDLADM